MPIAPISVVMPVRNGAAFITAALESLLGQTLPPAEIIVVDDGSTDDTAAVVAAIAARAPSIQLVRQPPSGIAPARQRGADAARQPFLACLDADDIAEPERFALQLAAFDRDPGLVLCGGAAWEIDGDGKRIGERNYALDHVELSQILESWNPFLHSTVLMRRDAFDRVGGYRGAFSVAEDYDLWLRLSEIGRVCNLPDKLAHYRMWPGSTTSTRYLKMEFIADLARRSAQFRRETGADPADGLDDEPDFLGDGWHDSPFWPEILRYRLRARFRPTMTAEDWRVACDDLTAAAGLLGSDDRRFLSRVLTERLLAPGLSARERAGSALQLVKSGRRKAFTALYRQLTGRDRQPAID